MGGKVEYVFYYFAGRSDQLLLSLFPFPRERNANTSVFSFSFSYVSNCDEMREGEDSGFVCTYV